jgi:hypothetical protein
VINDFALIAVQIALEHYLGSVMSGKEYFPAKEVNEIYAHLMMTDAKFKLQKNENTNS